MRVLMVVAASVVLCGVTGMAHAQVCGDADGSGAVSVSDGVQALRAAAGLSTSCTAERCDVDGNGSISVTDGVNVLRKAAGLAIAEACVGGTVSALGAFLGEMTKIARLPVAASGGGLDMVVGAVTSDCDTGFLEAEGEKTTFFDCRFGDLLLNGAVTSVVALSDVENGRFIKTDTFEDYEVQLLDSGFTFRQDGIMTIDIDTKAHRLVEDGTLTIFHAQSASGQEEYTLTKRQLTTDTETGTVVTGELVSALAQAGLAGIKAVTLGFVTGVLADVDVEFDDGHFEAFTYNLETRALRPATSAAASGERRGDPALGERRRQIAGQKGRRTFHTAHVRVHVGEPEPAREMVGALRRT